MFKKKKKPKMIMLVGLPASGKSKLSQELAQKYNANIHSSDEIRAELFGNDFESCVHAVVFEELHRRAIKDLSKGKSVIYDATNLKYKYRKYFLRKLERYDCEKECIIVATPFSVCFERNLLRGEKAVPPNVMKRMRNNFNIPYWYEGWDKITIHYTERSFMKRLTVDGFFHVFDDFSQDNKHHRLTLGEHMKETAKNFSKRKNELYYSALLHDWVNLLPRHL